MRNAEEQENFKILGADAAVVAAYGLILPKEVLEAYPLGCINVHASMLPRWRGAAPIQRAILAGDEVSGVTIMQMDEGLDTGNILLEDKRPGAVGKHYRRGTARPAGRARSRNDCRISAQSCGLSAAQAG